jgi:hypothetical protein
VLLVGLAKIIPKNMTSFAMFSWIVGGMSIGSIFSGFEKIVSL